MKCTSTEAETQFTLGSKYFDWQDFGGSRGLKDLADARRLYGLAAAQGHVGAQLILGSMHLYGAGGLNDFAEARRLLRS